ncbi:beta-ketoacyl-ACP synthase [Falsiroseomonas bella]|uniref:Beta-ketoacyl-ACP synthase n=1 Tax=Falsiroseomonas bella TaxID=2184016 RepID=A0A317FD10_9PROT|nr:beta-ketoacyl-ACP synthase [Falsiroseomonas bella]PWS35428.1 beta-ketoacyl-ACP synthase [Falsiroseomonas bella]
MADNDIWITGVGLVSSAGEGRAAHLAALAAPRPAALDEGSFAPFTIHPGPALELDRQIPKKGDQRQMEPWQRLGTYTAGLAIDDAGARGLVGDMDLIVAAGGGERDIALDDAVLSALAPLPAPEAAVKLNEMLAGGLRPTLFLAQLSNLLAGNISIVQGVTGASRTFMGEEQAGADAVRIAAARLAEGNSPIALAGGAYSAPRWDMLMLYHAGSLLRRGPWAPVFSREDAPGAVTGTLSGFVVMETAAHARARGARGLARLNTVASAQARRNAEDTGHAAMGQAFARIAPRLGEGVLPIISGCTGATIPTVLEREVLGALTRPLAVRATGSRFGWGVEATFPANVALAALCLSQGVFPAPMEALEARYEDAPRDILVTGFAAWRGEAIAHLSAIPAGDQP